MENRQSLASSVRDSTNHSKKFSFINVGERSNVVNGDANTKNEHNEGIGALQNYIDIHSQRNVYIYLLDWQANRSGPSSRSCSGPAPNSQHSSADLSVHSEVSDEHLHSPSERSNQGGILAEQSSNIEILDQSSTRDDDSAIQNLQPIQGDSGDPAQPPWKRLRILSALWFLLGSGIILLVVLPILKKTGHLGRHQQPLSGYSLSKTTSRFTIAASSHIKLPSLGNESLTSSSGSLSSLSSTRPISFLALSSTGLPPDISATTTTTLLSQALQTNFLSTIRMSSEAAPAAATPVSPLLPTVSRASSMTSVLFGATGPPKTMRSGASTIVCTRWSGLGCPGDRCYANTCVDPLPCWKGICCTIGCATGWECTDTCVSALTCVTKSGQSVGTCSASV
ncbi:uncharacterized protein K441DRAFT_247565 [Cenococcum geophilum 1.58]|uniref:uncharacterized protein n=1 Tax=Cenococcum geophilum 1.58 TaxID=794803 RepID=UPI00358E6B60|nr:hypothetical protein K441DRAFT_247565 [Cenococcum geophilum 1.58]